MSEEPKAKLESGGELSDVDNENCSSSGSGSCETTKRTCVDCGTIRTPLWRGGPAGPKSLCNACGIKNRKKRQASLGIKPEEENKKMKKKKIRKSSSSSDLSLETCNNKSGTSTSSSISSKGVSKVLDLGIKVPVMKRSAVEKERLWNKLSEEERAAVLLIAISCDSVYS